MSHRNNILYCNCEIKPKGKFFPAGITKKYSCSFSILLDSMYSLRDAKYHAKAA